MRERTALQDWLTQQLSTGFAAFAGARLAATVPFEESLINELIGEALAAATAPPSGGPSAHASPLAGLDLAHLARLVRHARVHATSGVITLDFEIAVDERPGSATRPG
ncbi:MAG: hypothetical protein ACR2LU_13265 [Luteitalea sp.]